MRRQPAEWVVAVQPTAHATSAGVSERHTAIFCCHLLVGAR